MFFILGVSSTQTVQAGSDYGASTWAVYFKDVMIKAAAQTAFKVLSNKIISKIQTGGAGGKAAFVQDWIKFATQAQYQGESIFRAELTNSHLCSDFSNAIKGAFGVKSTDKISIAGQNVRTDSLETYGLKTNCTMPSGFTTSNYQKDFAGNGGWQAFSRMLEPQNNYYGTLFSSLDEVAKQRNLSQSSAINNAVAGKGFTGLMGTCKTLGLGNVCNSFGDIKTPGSVLDQAAGDATSKGTTALLAGADGASIAVSALTTWALNKMFDLGGSSTNDSTDVSITSEQRTSESYNQEFCTAADNISNEAKTYVKNNFPQAYRDFPPGTGSNFSFLPGHSNGLGSYCQSLYDTANSYPYSRCSQACLKAVGEAPSLAAPAIPPPSPEGTCTVKDGGINHSDIVTSVINQIGPTQTTHTACDEFEITKNVAWQLKDEGAGLQKKTSGTNCGGYSVDIIAYPDGTTYDVVSDLGTTWGPSWSPSCLIDASQYAPAITP